MAPLSASKAKRQQEKEAKAAAKGKSTTKSSKSGTTDATGITDGSEMKKLSVAADRWVWFIWPLIF